MDIKDLTTEQKAELKRQWEEEERAEKERKKQDRETLKKLQDEYVKKYFPQLEEVANKLSALKAAMHEDASTILGLKKSVYSTSDEAFERQQSHSVSTLNFDKTILVGYNVVDGWDTDLAICGVDGVNKWLQKKLNDDNKELVDMIRDLLRPNKDGVLKANRVLELYNRATKIGDKELIESVANIQSAYIPKKTSTFIKAKQKNGSGEDVWLNLSMSNA